MKNFLFCLFAGFGFVLLFNGVYLLPPTATPKWWSAAIGFALLTAAFRMDKTNE